MTAPFSDLHIRSLSAQVGGHAGILTTEDNELLIKSALPRELEFYQLLQANESLSPLRPYIPKFFGTLTLEGELDNDKTSDQGVIAVKPNSVSERKVLENITYRFTKPNILDIKLGTIFYDDLASPEKVARMIQTAKNTTSLETGLRLTGFQVYDNITGQPVNTPKSYGKAIKVSELLEGITKFFPEGKEGITEASSQGSNGLPRATLRSVLEGIIEEVKEIRDTFAEMEMRVVGGSLLVVYEADWDKAKEGLQNFDKADEEMVDEEGDESDEDDKGPPYAVKLIDFAHTKVVPGQGPDEGVLLGFNSTIKLLNERLSQLV